MDKVIKKCKTHYEINKKEERKNPKTNFQPNRQNKTRTIGETNENAKYFVYNKKKTSTYAQPRK